MKCEEVREKGEKEKLEGSRAKREGSKMRHFTEYGDPPKCIGRG